MTGAAGASSRRTPSQTTTRYVIVVMIAVGVLYLTVWPHELGHASVAYLYCCKANWWQTDTSWYLWSSWGGRYGAHKIDYECLRAQGGPALAMEEFAGIAVNLFLLGMAPLVGCWGRSGPARSGSSGTRWPWLFLATFFWALANYAEAFSYLVLNTIWPKSDMESVVLESGVSRWLWVCLGTFLAVLAAKLLLKPARKAATILSGPTGSSSAWMGAFGLYVGVVGAVMAVARIRLT